MRFWLVVLIAVPLALFAGEPTFRTDEGDQKLPWFQLKNGEFPPEGSAHYIGGELIGVDHINRTGTLRQDRTDAVVRGDWDRPLRFVALPYGSFSYHGAPAELRDIPIGTHLHGLFYGDSPGVESKDSKGKKIPAREPVFDRALLLEDDFSHSIRLQRAWRVDVVDLDKGTLTVSEVGADGKEVGKAKPFSITAATRVWKGRSIGQLSDLAAGQSVLMNLTVCTMKGPGRCTDIWLDAESRAVASAHQKEKHYLFQREHGLAGWVDEVDNKEGIVAVTLFGGFDPKLKEDFPKNDVINALVAEDSLRTWDQINDKKSGPIIEVLSVPAGPGNSGFRIKFKPSMLLEGYRPKRIVRLLSSKWKLDDLPREERLY